MVTFFMAKNIGCANTINKHIWGMVIELDFINSKYKNLFQKKCERSILATLPLLVFDPHPLI